jgi:hypothetical protein
MNALNHAHRIKAALISLLMCSIVLTVIVEVILHPPHTTQRDLTSRTPLADLAQPDTTPRTIPDMLAQLNSRLDPKTCGYLNAQRADLLHADLTDPTRPSDFSTQMTMEVQYADELLNAGKSDAALHEYQTIEKQVKASAPDEWAAVSPYLLKKEALSYLRLGEQQNCCSSNNARSCLIPISGTGIHTKQYGSRGAIQCLTEELKSHSDDLSSRWLLNLAYMTVGEYPSKVPSRWLIPLKRYGADYPMKKFTNVAPQMGLDLLGWAGSVVMEDFEGNGLLDLVISSSRPDGQLRYFRNNGDGTFTERTKEAGLLGEVGGLNMITTDYNNDGRPDLVVLRGGWFYESGHYPLSLLRNDGKGHFTDVTLQAGLLTYGPTQAAVAFDYNGDGLLDLFVGYEASPTVAGACKLFRNNGNGTFTDVTKECGLDIARFVKGVVSADFMHSGRPGLYLSCFDGPSILLRNDGPAGPDRSPAAAWKFTDVSHQAGVDKQHCTFSCFFFDYDNDGWPDLYVGGYQAGNVGDVAKDYLGLPTTATKAKLYHNNRDGTFTDVTAQSHLDKVILGMGINYGDLDNDGWLDFYVGTGNTDIGMLIPKRMFRNHDGKYFDEVTITGDFGHLQKGHGIAFGDINNNGQQDVFIVLGGAYEGDTAHDALFLNPGNTNHWLTLQLSGTKSNRIALGAEICVTVATPQGERRIYRTVSTGGSFGNNPLRQEIGLGSATGIKQVSIRWPASGIEQTLTHLKMDAFYKVREGEPAAEPWHVPTFKLPVGAGNSKVASR